MADNYEYQKCTWTAPTKTGYEYEPCAPPVYPPEIVYVNDAGKISPLYVDDAGTIKVVFQRRHQKTAYEYAKCNW